jgi:hypothetical protein
MGAVREMGFIPYAFLSLAWLEGKEARAEYHALLQEELASLRG